MLLHSILSLLIVLLLLNTGTASNPKQPSDANVFSEKMFLTCQKSALELELNLVQTNPKSYYLVIDLVVKKIYLKSGARILRTCSIEDHKMLHFKKTKLLQMIKRIDPITPEPANLGLRLRGRALPLNFIGRLIEGPRKLSRLYFSSSVVIQSIDLPILKDISYLKIDGGDIKALGSALNPGSSAILIPTLENQLKGRGGS